ncbi:MAG: FtsX-like permease family protein [Gemmatimonadota bacterium]
MKPTPPALFRKLLAHVVPDGASGPSVLGDLHEEYVRIYGSRGHARAHLWYATQVVMIGIPYAAATSAAVAQRSLVGLGQGLSLDLRHAARGLRANGVMTAVAVSSLVVGTGGAIASAGLVDALWLSPLPYPGAQRLVDLEDMHDQHVCSGCSAGASYRSFSEWQTLDFFEDVTAMSGGSRTMEVGDRSIPVPATEVAENFFDFMGGRTSLGRFILTGDAAADAPAVVVLGHGLWTGAFGADSSVVNTSIRIDGLPHTVVGVMGRDFRALDRARMWTALRDPGASSSFDQRELWVIARLSAGVTTQEADMGLRTYAASRYSSVSGLEPGWYAKVESLRSVVSDEIGPLGMGMGLLAATLIVLFVACANLAALMLARVTEREAELGIRIALGSNRFRLARVAVLESVVIAVLGTGIGLLAAVALTELVGERARGAFPGWVDLGLDARMAAMAVATTVGTAVACGLLPALRSYSVKPGRESLHAALGGRDRDRLRRHDLLLGVQVALGVVLVGGALSAARSVVRVIDFDSLGHRYAGIHTVEIDSPVGTHGTLAESNELVEALGVALGAHPSVGGWVATRPLFLGSWGNADGPSPVRTEGSVEAVPDRVVPRHSLAVGAGYFEQMEIPLLVGRGIGLGDRVGGDPVAVVSAAGARALWGDVAPTDVLGRGFSVELSGGTQSFTVVGVSRDVVGNPRSERRRAMPMIYTALAQTEPWAFDHGPARDVTFQLDLRSTPPGLPEVEAIVSESRAGVAVARSGSLRDTLLLWIMPVLIIGAVMTALSTIGLGLLMLGVYGTLSYRVARSRRELGVRIAIGARPVEVFRAASHRVVRVLAVSGLIGIGISAPVAHTIGAGDIPLGGSDPWVLVMTATVLASLCGLSCLGPVRRALATDPIESLKSD